MRDNHSFKRPYRPVGTQDCEAIIIKEYSLSPSVLFAQVIPQEGSPVVIEISVLLLEFLGGFIHDVRGAPYLTVRMRVGAPHHGAFIFKNLHIPNKIVRTKFQCLIYPGGNNILDGR